MTLRKIEHLSDLYWLAVTLRREVLRYPLGLDFTEEQLNSEGEIWHYVYECGGEVLGTAQAYRHENGTVQIKQVASRVDVQGRGVGTTLMKFVEQDLVDNGYSEVFLHAREVSIPFYKKLKYIEFDEPFMEVGIEHRKMRKQLLPK